MNEIWIILQPYISKAIAVIIVFVVTYLLSKLLTKIVGGVFRVPETGYVVRAVEIIKILLYVTAAIVVANIIAPEAQIFVFLVLLIGLAVIAMFLDVLRNIGGELYIRSKELIKRGDWIEIDGISMRILELDAMGVICETPRLEKVFIPYSKLLSSIVINRTTPLGMLIRIYVDVPRVYGIDGIRNILLEAVAIVKEDLVTEPDITYLGSRGDILNFVIEFHIMSYRKLTKVLSAIEREIKNRIPEAVLRA